MNSTRESGDAKEMWFMVCLRVSPNLKAARKYANMAKGDKINNQITSIQLMSIYLTALRPVGPPDC